MNETFRPFDYQIPMVEHLLANDRAALFVSPGKGKTVVTDRKSTRSTPHPATTSRQASDSSTSLP